jgi:4,5-DOPA dioxygenase extradiol
MYSCGYSLVMGTEIGFKLIHLSGGSTAEMLPAIFFGHGNPMNAVLHNRYTEAWQRIGEQLPRPKAILSISAHWFVPETGVTISTAPRTIHDFGGFPPELYRVQYPAPGDPDLARRVQEMLAPLPVKLDDSWGLV